MALKIGKFKQLAKRRLSPRWTFFFNVLRTAAGGNSVFIPFKATYNEDGLACNKNMPFLDEEKFRTAYANAVAKGLYVDANIRWRCHVACWAGMMALRLGGDFVECGVNKGFLSHILMEYLDFDSSGRSFYLVDTYQGFDGRYLTSMERERLVGFAASTDSGKPWEMGMYEPCYEVVVGAFSGFKGARIVKGAVPDVLPEVRAESVAYLSIDMNCVAPEIAALEHFWPKMLVGGVVLLDDYAWPGHEEQMVAMDDFARRAGTKILCLPTGQGLLIKH